MESLFNHCISVCFQEKQLGSEWLTLLSPNHLFSVLSMASIHSGSQGQAWNVCRVSSGPWLYTVIFLIEVVSIKDHFCTPSGQLGNSELAPPETITFTVVFTERTQCCRNKNNCGKILEHKHLNNSGGYFPEACWLQWFCYRVTLWVMLPEL